MDLLDQFANTFQLRQNLLELYLQSIQLREQINRLKNIENESSLRINDLTYQVKELQSAELNPMEEEDLSKKREIFKHQEKILITLRQIDMELNGSDDENGTGLATRLNRVTKYLKELANIDSRWQTILESNIQTSLTLEQTILDINSHKKEFDLDPQSLETIEERLNYLYQLKRKYRADNINQLLTFLSEWEQELETLQHRTEELEELELQYKELCNRLGKQAEQLSKKRIQAAKRFTAMVTRELKSLDLPHAEFSITVDQKVTSGGWLSYADQSYDLGTTGWDDITFWFSANPGEAIKPLSKVISGGELSRAMLAIKSIFAEADQIPILIFDEIDAGIGGHTGQKVADKLQQLGKNHQVLAITHLPTIAARAAQHFVVLKTVEENKTNTTVHEVTRQDRIHEINRMLGGGENDPASLKYSRELLNSK